MSLFSRLFGSNEEDTGSTSEQNLTTAEQYIREHKNLYDHYGLNEVVNSTRQWGGVEISEQEALDIINRKRREIGWEDRTR